MRNIKLTLQCDGTDFAGYELQPMKRTIRGEIEKALLKVFKTRIKINSSSRTDAGVHALGNVVSFKTKIAIPVDKIPAALNSILPEDIRVVKAEAKAEARGKGFNARFDAKSKEYQYLVFNGQVLPPHLRRITWQVKPELDLAAMKRAAKLLIGKHDFSSFCAAGGDDNDFVRTIYKLKVQKTKVKIWEGRAQEVIRFTVRGNGFLYKMVRNIVGTLVEVGLGRTSVKQFKNILEAKDRRLAGRTAPGQGLCLIAAHY